MVGVLGAGAMGHGIAQLAAQAGCQVMLHDTNADSLTAAAGPVPLMKFRHATLGLSLFHVED
jgi:3-hydroxyacyl-CoA dehydrogenase